MIRVICCCDPMSFFSLFFPFALIPLKIFRFLSHFYHYTNLFSHIRGLGHSQFYEHHPSSSDITSHFNRCFLTFGITSLSLWRHSFWYITALPTRVISPKWGLFKLFVARWILDLFSHIIVFKLFSFKYPFKLLLSFVVYLSCLSWL